MILFCVNDTIYDGKPANTKFLRTYYSNTCVFVVVAWLPVVVFPFCSVFTEQAFSALQLTSERQEKIFS